MAILRVQSGTDKGEGPDARYLLPSGHHPINRVLSAEGSFLPGHHADDEEAGVGCGTAKRRHPGHHALHFPLSAQFLQWHFQFVHGLDHPFDAGPF